MVLPIQSPERLYNQIDNKYRQRRLAPKLRRLMHTWVWMIWLAMGMTKFILRRARTPHSSKRSVRKGSHGGSTAKVPVFIIVSITLSITEIIVSQEDRQFLCSLRTYCHHYIKMVLDAYYSHSGRLHTRQMSERRPPAPAAIPTSGTTPRCSVFYTKSHNVHVADPIHGLPR